MSELQRAVEALMHAADAQSKATLSLIDEAAQSRVIQSEIARSNQQIAETLGAILDGQTRIEQRMEALGQRQNTVERKQSDSEGRLRVVESKLENVQAEVRSLKAAIPQPQSATG